MGIDDLDSTAERLQQHCPIAWASFYRGNVRDVWRFAYRRLGDSHAADELVSLTFLAAVESIDRYDPRAGTPRRWLFGIARRKLAEQLRKRYRQRSLDRSIDELNIPFAVEHDNHQEVKDRVHAALTTLPPLHRDVLLWLYQDQASVRDIAERLNRTEKASENLLYRARQRFRKAYGRMLESESTPSSA